MKTLISLFLISLLATPTHALEIQGPLKQGGFIIGKTVENAKVSLGKYSTQTDNNGTFVIGIPRNQEEESELSILLLEGIEERHRLQIKQQTYKTQAIKGIPKRKVTPNEDDLRIIKEDKKQILAARATYETLPHIWQQPIRPTSGPLTGVYGSRRTYNGEERNWHKGVDFAAPTGTPVKAPVDATVRLALKDSFFNGNLVILDHGHQLFSIYAHLNSMTVKAGDKIKQSDIIGTVGETGRATGPHLHWGLYWRNMALDPLLWLGHKSNEKGEAS